MQDKSCTKCGQLKPVSAFHLYPSGHPKSWCKECQVAYVAEQRRLVPKKGHQKSPPGHRQKMNKAYRLMSKFGITQRDYDTLYAAQGGVCAICGKPESKVLREQVKALAVDHCHVSGKVRGLLCHACNVGIGMFQDSPKLLVSAAEYVQHHVSS